MALPAFNADGDLPAGVYSVTLREALARFSSGLPQRLVIGARLAHLYELAFSTGKVARFVVFGSFVTAKPDPRDIDIVLVMENDFDVSSVAGDAAVVFRHVDADARLGASVFWATRSGAFGGEQALIEYWQARRDGRRRGILELVPEGA